ncbi:MFS transporter [Bacillus cereus]|uniref:MFS transporter n=1 Tax=Bacillus cereus TaxID=1396 RepID=UPI000BF5EBD9|nr:MFS transporter [Bacillus cereus]PFA20173.1 MFS transporter [Bacillus cereus]PGZ15175.1 MFS transporter [Bacillus cereus]
MSSSLIHGQVRTPIKRLTFGIMFGYACMMIALVTPAMLLLTFKMMEIDPNGYTYSFGLVASIGALFALIGNPLGGAISDRTNIAFGRRRTWIVIGPLIGSVTLLWVGMATEIWQVVVGWSIAQLFFNFGMAAFNALVPDQVPEEKQGTTSGLLGLVAPIAIAIGMGLMTVMADAPLIMKWALLSAIGIMGPIISVLFIKEGKIEIERVKTNQISLTEKLSRIYPSPRKFPEFTWAMLSKFLLMLGFGASAYLTVMLVNRMGYSAAEATSRVATLQIISFACMALTSVLGGILSDKLKKQKPFLYVSAFIMLIGTLVFAFVPDYTAFIIATIVIGLGAGCFTAVDMALVSRILPSKEDAAKDFGLMNIANTLPTSIVPAIAPLLLTTGGWPFFYIALAACILFSIFTIKPLPEIGEALEEKKKCVHLDSNMKNI